MQSGNKYSQTINAEIDLHRLTIDEAIREVDRFVEDAETLGLRYVLIITGKGLHSDAGALTIREAVKAWLFDHGFAFRYAKPSQGGEGALIVTIFES